MTERDLNGRVATYTNRADHLTDTQCRIVAHLLADRVDHGETVTAADLDRWLTTVVEGYHTPQQEPAPTET